MAGKHLALMDYLSRNPVAPPQTDDEYDKEYVINSILPHCTFISSYGCLSNHINQSECRTEESERKANTKPWKNDTRQQTALDWFHSDTYTRSDPNELNKDKCINITMDAGRIDIEASNPSAEITELVSRWREPGTYRMTAGRWKRYLEPKFLRNERKVIIERLQQLTNNWSKEDLRQKSGTQHRGGFQPPSGNPEQWTVDPFWKMNRPTPVQSSQNYRPGPSSVSTSRNHEMPVPMKEGEINSETDQDP